MAQLIDICTGPEDVAADRAFHDVLESFGSDRFDSHTIDATRSVVDAERIHAFEFNPVEGSHHLYCSWFAGGNFDVLNAEYSELFRDADPVHRAPGAAQKAGVPLMLRVCSHDIDHSDYRRRFFDRFGISDRVSVIRPVGTAWIAMSVARRGRRFSDKETGALVSLGRMVLPLIRRHHLSWSRGRMDVAAAEARFTEAFPMMPDRERQVCARTMIGMTAEAAAIDLGIAISTVLTYRRRAYQRMNICSAFELAAKVMR